MKRKAFMRIGMLISLVFIMIFSVIPAEVQAQKEKVGWVGPVYKELSDSLMKGFKEFYKKT